MDYRTALITGASSGIGAALARRLARRGVAVAIAARRGDSLAALAADIAAAGGRASVLPLDVSDAAATLAAVERIDDQLGGLDLVVANAGVSLDRWAGELTFADCARLIAVNVTGAVATLTAVLPRMLERRRGHLVGVTSLAQYRGVPTHALYSASKAFLATFLEGLRVDLRGSGIAVTDVRPGFVRTPMTARNRFPMPLMLEVDEAAAIIERGIELRQALIAFPWPLVAAMRGLRLLPRGLYDRLATMAPLR